MKVSIEAGWGRWNKDYKCVLLRPDEGDNHYRPKSYMPKHTELAEMLKALMSCEPLSKRTILKEMFFTAIAEGEAEAELNPEACNPRPKKVIKVSTPDSEGATESAESL